MNASTSINYVLWVAAGGAVGALVHYLAVTVAGPRIGAGRVALPLNSCACMLLGIMVASGPSGHGYPFFAVGVLGSVAPFTAVAEQALDRTRPRYRLRTMLLAMWMGLAGVSMAIVGYILADAGSIAFEKVPGSLR
ncbi:hypothetical protein [Rhodococcus koreensis]|uniref:Fluoride ion transporter CrcB n=1 Tax=Rhodococcus koreensis TaxID=99653 RepID=A0A1H4R2L4_9NOCA|nr:hypothetical protein [Rhodococcus koreensis]SEC26056.1 hypothetical protein SAMN04490239_3451 [Rhodococcus koreensis]